MSARRHHSEDKLQPVKEDGAGDYLQKFGYVKPGNYLMNTSGMAGDMANPFEAAVKAFQVGSIVDGQTELTISKSVSILQPVKMISKFPGICEPSGNRSSGRKDAQKDGGTSLRAARRGRANVDGRRHASIQVEKERSDVSLHERNAGFAQ